MRPRIRFLAISLTLLSTFVTACSEQNSAPQSFANPEASGVTIENYVTPCSATDIKTYVKDLFPGVIGTLLTIKLNAYIALSPTGPSPKAQAKLMDIINDVLTAVHNGQFGTDPVKLHKVESFIRLLYCILGVQAPPLDLVSGGAAVITPQSPPTVVGAKDPLNVQANLAATLVQGSNLPANTPSVVVTIVPIANSTGPLDTPLQQRGPFYQLTTSPEIRFATPVLVGACINLVGDDSDNRVRLAHNYDPSEPVTPGNIRFGNIEIISPANDLTGLNLTCTPPVIGFLKRAANLLLPENLFAGTTGTGGKGGLASKYSPFGGVVPEALGFGLPNWLYQQPSTGNPAIPSTTQGGQGVSFFAAGGATTPSNGATFQGTWTFGSAPFGDTQSGGVVYSGAAQCDGTGGTINYNIATASLWARASAGSTSDPTQYTYLYARRVFYSANTTDPVRLALDNDIRVWVNGTEVTASATVDGSPASIDGWGFLLKEGCAKTNQVLVSVPRAGVNVISVQSRDRGVASYFDASQASVAVPAGQ